MTDRLFKCRVLIDGKLRCGFDGSDDEAAVHMRETGHKRCIVCIKFLLEDERQTCLKCIGRTRAALVDIVESVALAGDVIEAAGYHGTILIDLIAMVSDGSIESPVQQAAAELYAYAEHPKDPIPVIAALYGIERCWREEFGHTARMTDATISSCAAYLTEWLTLAARTWPGFDDDATTLLALANTLRHKVGTADDPVTGTKCLDCDTTLVQPYRQPILPVPDARRSHDGVRGQEPEGRDDIWHCRRCRRDYTPAEYGLAQAQRVRDAEGWVRIGLASEVTGHHRKVIWGWVNRKLVKISNDERYALVWMPDVREMAEQARLRHAERERRREERASA